MPPETTVSATAPGRLRKAWRASIPSYDTTSDIVYGETRSKARSELWREINDCIDCRVIDIRVVRAKERDVTLPIRHPIADQLTPEQTLCLLHSFGADQGNPYWAGRRDYFYTYANDKALCRLAELGLTTPTDISWEDNLTPSGMTYFVLTELGKQVALSLVPAYR